MTHRTLPSEHPNLRLAATRLRRTMWIWAALAAGMGLLTAAPAGGGALVPGPRLVGGRSPDGALRPAGAPARTDRRALWALSMVAWIPGVARRLGRRRSDDAAPAGRVRIDRPGCRARAAGGHRLEPVPLLPHAVRHRSGGGARSEPAAHPGGRSQSHATPGRWPAACSAPRRSWRRSARAGSDHACPPGPDPGRTASCIAGARAGAGRGLLADDSDAVRRCWAQGLAASASSWRWRPEPPFPADAATPFLMRPATAPPPGRVPEPAVYRARATEVNLLLALGIVGTGLGLALLAIGVWAWIFATTTYGPAAVPRWANAWFAASPVAGCSSESPGWLRCLVAAPTARRGARRRAARRSRRRTLRRIPWSTIREVRAAPRRARGHGAALDLRLRRTAAGVRATARWPIWTRWSSSVKRGAFPGLLEDCRQQVQPWRDARLWPAAFDARRGAGRPEGHTMEGRAGGRCPGRPVGHQRTAARHTRLRVAAERVPNVDVCVQLVRHLGQVP